MYLYSNNAIFFILTIEVLVTVVFIIMDCKPSFKRQAAYKGKRRGEWA